VQQTLMAPPQCRIGTITDEERATVRSRSPVGAKYDTAVNRESAYEILKRRAEEASQPAATPTPSAGGTRSAPAADSGMGKTVRDWLFGTGRRQGVLEATAKSTMRTVGNQIGREILRGILGNPRRRR
jgi:hypothetical protein